MTAAAINICTLISNDLLNKTGVQPVSRPVEQILVFFKEFPKKVMLPLKYPIYWERVLRKKEWRS